MVCLITGPYSTSCFWVKRKVPKSHRQLQKVHKNQDTPVKFLHPGLGPLCSMNLTEGLPAGKPETNQVWTGNMKTESDPASCSECRCFLHPLKPAYCLNTAEKTLFVSPMLPDTRGPLWLQMTTKRSEDESEPVRIRCVSSWKFM